MTRHDRIRMMHWHQARADDQTLSKRMIWFHQRAWTTIRAELTAHRREAVKMRQSASWSEFCAAWRRHLRLKSRREL